VTAPVECAYEDCDRAARAKGWCPAHYDQQWRRGWLGPIGGGRKRRPAEPDCEVPCRWTGERCGRPVWRVRVCRDHWEAIRTLGAGVAS